MSLKDRIPWTGLLAQSAIIVASILTALGADAWWAARQDAATARENLEALQRDFTLAQGRVAESIRVASQSERELLALFMAVDRGEAVALGREAFLKIHHAVRYEVFSFPRGAYDAMVNAGEAKLLSSKALKQELADFYGGFDDMRVTEQQLLRTVLGFQTSDVFERKVNWAELGYSIGHPDQPIGSRLEERIASWSGDAQLENWLLLITVHQAAVQEDYLFLAERIDLILHSLAVALG
ncbi:MAG: hypothetical protein O2816_17140 [Planctomycetota bacterium]|nr:hypothetical protein [Planctomycetota bacterium]